jgi:hypothetical protein
MEESGCYVCNPTLLDNKEYKKKKCRKCIQSSNRKRVREDPVKLLYQKFASSQRKRPLVSEDLINQEVVREVYERCEQKCVLTGETDHLLLCIFCKTREEQEGGINNVNELVLLATKEAHRIIRLPEEERQKLLEPKQ